MEDESLSRVNGGNRSRLSGPSASTALSLPLTRYTTRLITTAANHRHTMLLRGCGVPRSEDGVVLDGSGGRDIEGENSTINDSDSDSYYSKPIVVVLDLIWNLAFVVVSMVVLLAASRERPSTPLRVWVCGYALQCVLHVGFVFLEYHRTNNRRDDGDDDDDHHDHLGVARVSASQNRSSIVKRLESINTIISSIWWVIGFYWIVVGGQALLQDSPRLYWLTVVFLAFDVFFIIFCIGMAFVAFFALFCCIPVVAIAYAVATRQGASEDDIRSLPKYKYRQASPLRMLDTDMKQEMLGASNKNSSINELVLPPEDSECCICLSRYVDGAELCTLPCNHHFHCGCISKWLRINATCPLCKFNICRGDTLV